MSLQNWIEREGYRKRHSSESEIVYPMKVRKTTPWQKHLQNFADTEGIMVVMVHKIALT